MKVTLATGLIILTIITINSSTATSQGTNGAHAIGTLPASVIDDVEVPYEVVEYAQLQHQGHAITKVHRAQRDGQPIYKVRVDSDDNPTDYDSIILLYDQSWKLLGDEKLIAPPPASSREVSNNRRRSEENENRDEDRRQERKEEKKKDKKRD